MFDRGGPLRQALTNADGEIERIAAQLVQQGMPLFPALDRAREIYRKQQQRKQFNELLPKRK